MTDQPSRYKFLCQGHTQRNTWDIWLHPQDHKKNILICSRNNISCWWVGNLLHTWYSWLRNCIRDNLMGKTYNLLRSGKIHPCIWGWIQLGLSYCNLYCPLNTICIRFTTILKQSQVDIRNNQIDWCIDCSSFYIPCIYFSYSGKILTYTLHIPRLACRTINSSQCI